MNAGLVTLIVNLILSFIKDLLSKLRLNKLRDALDTQRSKTDETVLKASGDYQSFRDAYDTYMREYERSKDNNRDVPRTPDAVPPSSRITTTGSHRDGQAKKSPRRTNRRTSRRTRKSKKR